MTSRCIWRRRCAYVIARILGGVLVGVLALGAAGCSSANNTPEAKDLRQLVPGLLHAEPRRGMLSALLAQELDPTPLGSTLLLTADVSSPQDTIALTPPWQKTLAATSTSTAVIAAGSSGAVAVWAPATGEMTARLTVPKPLLVIASARHSQVAVSLDAGGGIGAWDLHDPYHPVFKALAHTPVPVSEVATLALGNADADILLLTKSGTLYSYDLATGTELAHEPWRAPHTGPATVTAASFYTVEYSGVTTVLIATPHDGVFRTELGSHASKRVIAPHAFSGRVTSLTEVPYSVPRYVLGTTAGTFEFEEKGQILNSHAGAPANGLALAEDPRTDASTLLAATPIGVSSTDVNAPTGSVTSLSEPIGEPMFSASQGATGPVGITADGSILVGRGEATGLSRPTVESTAVAAFTPDNDLLEARGYDATHIERLVKVRPGATMTPNGQLEDQILKSYYPASSWWNGPEVGQNGWFVDAAASDGKYVAAGGQDPTHTAVVLVWNAATGKPLRRLALTQGEPLASGAGSEAETAPPLVTQVTLLPHRHLLAAYSAIQELLVLWSTDTWQQVASIPVGPVADFDVSHDEATIMVVSTSDTISGVHAGNNNSTLLFIDTGRKSIRRRVTAPGAELGLYDGVNGIALLSNGGTRIDQRSESGAATHVPPIAVEGDGVSSATVRHNSPLIALGIHNGGVIVGDLASGQLSSPIPSPQGSQPADVEFSPNGDLLAAINAIPQERGLDEPGPPSLWNVSDQALEGRLCELTAGNPPPSQWKAWFPKVHPRQLCRAPVAPRPLSAPPRPSLAYRTWHEIHVANEAGASAVAGIDDSQLPPASFAWSPGGALAWTTENTLNIIDPSGRTQTYPCGCSGAGFQNEAPVTVAADGSALLRFPVGGGPPQRTALRLKARDGSKVFGAADGVVVVGGFTKLPERNSNTVLYRVPAKGPVQVLSRVPAGQIIGQASGSSPQGGVALISTLSGGACYNPDTVFILNVRTGSVLVTHMPPGIEAPTVRSLWWSPSGQLDAVIAPNCVKGTGGETNQPQGQLYRLSGTRFGLTGGQADSLEEGKTGTAAIYGKVPVASRAGTLTMRTHGGRLALTAPGVFGFSLEP